ncbi:hypothetical protein ACROYT_G010077 [Oculina patagonica]
MHKKTDLAAPLDIAWVWHVHMLAPQNYEQDCNNIVSMLVDHRLLTPHQRQVGLQRAKSVWKKTYPYEPFEINVYEDPCLVQTYSSRIKYNLEEACQRQFKFYYQVSLPHYRDSRFLKDAVDRYMTHLRLKKNNPDVFLVPCYDFDLIWHAHQLHPTKYKQTTTKLLGRILKHDDSVTDRTAGSKLYDSAIKTREIWKEADCSFDKAGAMYRGDPPDPKTAPHEQPVRSPLETSTEYQVYITKAEGINFDEEYKPISIRLADHRKTLVFSQVFTKRSAYSIPFIVNEERMIKIALCEGTWVLSCPKLMLSPEDMTRPLLLCETSTHRLLDSTIGNELFQCRVVHSNQGSNPLSAVEIVDLDGKTVASSHVLSPTALPHICAIERKKTCVYLDEACNGERAMLVRGEKDYGVCIGKWREMDATNGDEPNCFVEIKFFRLQGKQGWCKVRKFKGGLYQIDINSNSFMTVDIKEGIITTSPFCQDLPEILALALSVSILYLLCKPYVPKESRESWPCYHIHRQADRLSPMILAAGYYSTMVPTNTALMCKPALGFHDGPNLKYASYDLDKEFGSETEEDSRRGKAMRKAEKLRIREENEMWQEKTRRKLKEEKKWRKGKKKKKKVGGKKSGEERRGRKKGREEKREEKRR